MNLLAFRRFWQFAFCCLILIGGDSDAARLFATDFFLTLGGGYSPSGNQASLEANVVFFQQLLSERHSGAREHSVFFADGDDPGADLQVLVEPPAATSGEKPAAGETPATNLLAALHRRGGGFGGGRQIDYRNHQVPEVAGPLDPELVRTRLEALAATAGAGDRLIVFVTAHGSEDKSTDESKEKDAGGFNTSIDCWNNRKISAKEFTAWLDKLPSELPVIMVMAQCYCGGFSHTIFSDLDRAKGLSTHLRAGFFAQQHDLPAAGCRPDIEHDEEFSSYFWGAIAGRSRNGAPIEGCDADNDGVVSFAEAYAHAVIAGETIDIPLRTSEVLLRTYSGFALPNDKQNAATELSAMSGPLESLIASSRPVSARIVKDLAKALEVSLSDDVAAVQQKYNEHRQASRSQGRNRFRQRSGRRDVLKEVAEKWPELGEERTWGESPLLAADNQQALFAELQSLPSYKTYSERREQMAKADRESEEREIRTVKFRRLINALETIVLEKNLPRLAEAPIVEKYEKLIALEESSLSPTARN